MSKTEFPIDSLTNSVDLTESDEMNNLWKNLHALGLTIKENGGEFPVGFGKEVIAKIDQHAVDGDINPEFVDMLNRLLDIAIAEGRQREKLKQDFQSRERQNGTDV